MTEVANGELNHVTGGAGPTPSWESIRTQAAPHCPRTVEANPHAPANRAEAQRIGEACIAEMGSFKAGIGGGRRAIHDGIDQVFPR